MRKTLPRLALGGLFAVLSLLPALADPAPSLALKAGDVRVEARDDGFHLIVRQIPGLASVMLTESFELPDHKVATYSWRTAAPNAVNGAEKRLLNGQFLKQPNLFLISSTPVPDPVFGPAFEVLIPPTLEYGSATAPGARHGTLDVIAELAKPDGKVWFSIRTFAKPYQDYTGAYQDNAFELSTIKVAQDLAPDHGKYVKGSEDLFLRLGPTTKATDPADGAKLLTATLADNLDLVWAIDTTKSMKQDLAALRQDLVPQIEALTAGFAHFRLGFVFYRDYQELYLANTVPPSADPAVWKKQLNAAEAYGGGDVPEAPVEALDAGLGLFAGDPAPGTARRIVVFADAPQHDTPRGKVTEAQVLAKAKAKGVELKVILLPLTAF
jgi:hypothetical protein